ncbi:hypothetical protein HK098_001754 [Nowakowskiella sp. JEL0407]|nr:hypothetical protein HK098_001754 [Nowakowskiella sp. JEL0407]
MNPPESQQIISLNIGTLTGKTFTVDVTSNDTIEDVKVLIFEELGIPVESQCLVFREKNLNDNRATISGLGLRTGASLQLVIQMAGGPGPPLKLKKNIKDESSIVLVLCKQNDDIYMLELHMKDGQPIQTGNKPIRLITEDSEDDILIQPLNYFDGNPMNDTNSSRASSVPSTTASEKEIKEEIMNMINSRPLSGQSQDESILDYYTNSEDWEDAENDMWNNFKVEQSRKYPTTPRSKIRPATAISIMRTEKLPTVIHPKTRPVTASCHIQSILGKRVSQSGKKTPGVKEQKLKIVPQTDVDQSNEIPKSASSRKGKVQIKNHILPDSVETQHFKSQSQNITKIVADTITTPLPQISRRATPHKKSITPKKPEEKTNPASPLKKKLPRQTSTAKKVAQKRCAQCKKKLGLVTAFKCRCNANFCNLHRLPEVHKCTFNYKDEGKIVLIRENPVVKKEKVLRI